MKDSISELRERAAESRDSVEYKLEWAILDITEQIADCMHAKELNRAQLAKLLEVSPPMVTKMLNGTVNFTLKSLVGVAHVLGCDLSVRLAPAGFEAPRLAVWRGNFGFTGESAPTKVENIRVVGTGPARNVGVGRIAPSSKKGQVA